MVFTLDGVHFRGVFTLEGCSLKRVFTLEGWSLYRGGHLIGGHFIGWSLDRGSL